MILQRTALVNRWVSERWEPVAVEIAADLVPPALLPPVADPDDPSRWRCLGHAIELHRSEAEGYFLNVTSTEPKVFVMWRQADDQVRRPFVPRS